MYSNKLNFCSWNIHGYYSRDIGNKLRVKDFLDIIKNDDFVGVTETHIHEGILEELSIPGYHCLSFKNRKKNSKSNTAAGGIAIFVKQNLVKLFSVIELGNDDAIWVKLKKEFVGEDRDIYIATCYFSPSKGQVHEREIAKITENIMFLNSKGHVIINGDLNAKTSNLEDTIVPDKSDELFDITINEPPPKRNSRDITVNARGREMIDMCTSLDLNIVNGRKTGDLFGNYTCIKWNGNSVVDYLLTSASLFSHVSLFKIGEFVPWLSDHCPIHFTLVFHLEIQKRNIETPAKSAPKSFMWSEKGKTKFSNILKTAAFQNKVAKCVDLNYAEPNSVVNYISDTLIEAAEKAEIKTRRYSQEQDPPWFDNPCKRLKQDIKNVGEKSNATQKTSFLKENWHGRKMN